MGLRDVPIVPLASDPNQVIRSGEFIICKFKVVNDLTKIRGIELDKVEQFSFHAAECFCLRPIFLPCSWLHHFHNLCHEM